LAVKFDVVGAVTVYWGREIETAYVHSGDVRDASRVEEVHVWADEVELGRVKT
jgi:hypothetical protein